MTWESERAVGGGPFAFELPESGARCRSSAEVKERDRQNRRAGPPLNGAELHKPKARKRAGLMCARASARTGNISTPITGDRRKDSNSHRLLRLVQAEHA